MDQTPQWQELADGTWELDQGDTRCIVKPIPPQGANGPSISCYWRDLLSEHLVRGTYFGCPKTLDELKAYALKETAYVRDQGMSGAYQWMTKMWGT